MPSHSYRSRLQWSGSTADGYESYSRAHRVACSPSATTLELSGDAAFRGDPALLNPEQLLLAAASSCQLLSFLAIAARARIDVISYTDSAEALMPEDEEPVRITQITLRPHVVARDTDEQRVRRYLAAAHEQCYIANSLTSEIVIKPRIEVRRS
jgi:organic hydroperoxide reductase OsmC/OhrA